METLCCLGKMLYYVALILYTFCDSLFDLLNYFRKFADKEDFEVEYLLFFFSSDVGLIINIRMLMVYGHYNKFHWDCFLDGCSECPRKDHLCFNRLELRLSVVELMFKENIQSVIVFLIYASNTRLVFHRLFSLQHLCALQAMHFLHQEIMWMW